MIGWFFALYFCVKRKQENPRGAVLLGIAVLLQLTIFGGTFLSNFIRHEMENSTFWLNLRQL
ncbi:MAG TPA: hypothetical protein VLA12_19740, partial [Planctomycetaceae bacterium]|nr:hypothetical protein [Planctomycetaceae bacterium]